MIRTARTPGIAVAAATLACAAALTGCGSDARGGSGASGGSGSASTKAARNASGGHPFAGSWRSEGGEAGGGGTRLTVNADGTLRFESTMNCTGRSTAAADGRTYRFSFECGAARFTGTAPVPGTARQFTMTWEEGDTSAFQAENR